MANSEQSTQTTATVESKPKVSDEEFITQWPLYSAVRITNFEPPEQISFHCDLVCGKETTWLRVAHDNANTKANPTILSVCYKCVRCQRSSLVIFYHKLDYETVPGSDAISPARRVARKVLKVGQCPALSIIIPRGLEKNLGKDATQLYQKGIICRNNGYGLGAVVYIRRIVEDKTNELIEVAAELAESYNVDPEVVKTMRAATTERTTYDEKLRIAGAVLPEAIKVEGVNPLYALYSLVSQGIHEMNEEECLEIADETTEVFEFIFTKLRAEIADRKGFVEKIKKWSAKKS